MEQVLDDEAVERAQRLGDVARVRIGLREVFALNEEAAERPPTASASMLGMRKPGSASRWTCHFESNDARTAASEMCR